MRQLLVAILLVAAVDVGADDSPRAVVLKNECAKIAADMAFKCFVREYGLEMRWTANVAAMPEARRKEIMGEFHRVVMRYYDLGGRGYVITADRWPKSKERRCKITHTRTYRCSDYHCNADRSDCDPVYAPH